MKKTAKPTPNARLKGARERQGWSQEYVAREVGTDAFTISRWERGVTMPSPHFRQKLSTLFGLSVAELGLVTVGVEENSTGGNPIQGRPDEIAPLLPVAQAPVFDPAIPPPFAHGRELLGRADLLQRLKQQLLSSASLSALNGLPGVGKTALATALAHDEEMRARFADGVLWVGLGSEPDILGLLSRWGTLLNCAPADLAQRSRPQAWASSIHDAIGQRRMLLVIDDAWEIADALAFQVGGPNCSHLITTRFPEIARRFAAEGTIAVRELEDAEGYALLMRLAPEAVQAEPEEAQALVAAVGGLPLALTLLGNFLRAQAHSGQPRRLRAALARLHSADERLRLHEPQPLVGGHPGLSAGAPLSLQTMIGMSDQQVSEGARVALRALSVFPPKPNTFSEDAAAAVSAMPVEALDELMDAGLLESSGPERYTLHQTIADYARMHLSDSAVVARMVEYFVTYVEAHTTDYAALDDESNNIFAALEVAHEQGMLAALVRGVHAFAPVLITRGLYTVAEAQLQRSLEAAHSLGDASGQSTAWLHLGKIAEQQGNYVQAQAYWQNGLALAREREHRRSMAPTLYCLGDLAWKQGQLEQARQFFTKALEMLRQLDDQRGVADTLKSLGNLVVEQGQPEQASQLYGEALALYRRLGDQRGTAFTLHNLGVLAREQGQPEQACKLYEEALAILRLLGDRRSSAVVLGNMGNLARNQGHFEQSRRYLDESLSIQRDLGNRFGYAFTLLNLGNLAGDQGQYEQGRAFLNEALTILRDLQSLRNVAIALQTLGVLTCKQRQFEQAHRYFDEALALLRNLQDQRMSALTQREMATLAREEGQFELAYQLYAQALAGLDQLEDRREVAVTRLELAILERQQGRLQEAQQLLTEALTITREIKDLRPVSRILKELGLLAQQAAEEQALQLLLGAGVGLALLHSTDASTVEEALGQLRDQMGEKRFLAQVRQVAAGAPEPAYELDQAAWAAAIQKLVKQPLPR
ncbi:MAG TPA: tetratricopeptide repeat protein [Ktedonobacteraceae bacterium]|nr:tetratricopeptide repeat protein [Ktedonobacteraceae bacterium]